MSFYKLRMSGQGMPCTHKSYCGTDLASGVTGLLIWFDKLRMSEN